MRCASGTLEKSLPTTQQQMPSSLTNSFTETSSSTQYAEMNYPLFSFSRGRCLQHETLNEMSDSLYKPLQRQLQQINNDSLTQASNDDDSETEEFVLL